MSRSGRRQANPIASLSERQWRQLDQWQRQLDLAEGWCGSLPVVLWDRAWLRLEAVAIERLGQRLPPDGSADAPELVRFRELQQQGDDAWQAQLICWQEFGPEACQQALQRYWQRQQQGNQGWTLLAYLQFLQHYRQMLSGAALRFLPLVVLAREGGTEPHQLLWLAARGQPMRHTCP